MQRFTQGQQLPAGLGRRLGAMLYDSLLLCAIIMVGTGVAILFRTLFTPAETVAADPLGAVHGLFYQTFLLALCLAFFTCFWRLSGQTLGMQAWRIRAQNVDNSRLSVKQCLLRCLGGVLSWLCLGFGYWAIMFTAGKRSWSDMLSRSVIVHMPKEK